MPHVSVVGDGIEKQQQDIANLSKTDSYKTCRCRGNNSKIENDKSDAMMILENNFYNKTVC